MSKSIKDYTLGEVKELCQSIGSSAKDCPDCPLQRWCDNMMDTREYVPSDWDLTDPPRWNEGEVALATALYQAGARTITRYESKDSDLRVVGERNEFGMARAWGLPYKLFPSLRINETVQLEEIINAETE